MPEADKHPMSFISVLIGFSLGLLFLAAAIVTLLAGNWIGLSLLAIALLLLPPVRWLVYRYSGLQLSALQRTLLITLLLALFVILLEFFAIGVAPEVTEQTPLPELMAPQSPDSEQEAAP